MRTKGFLVYCDLTLGFLRVFLLVWQHKVMIVNLMLHK